jgi:hypothetical protein
MLDMQLAPLILKPPQQVARDYFALSAAVEQPRWMLSRNFYLGGLGWNHVGFFLLSIRRAG